MRPKRVTGKLLRRAIISAVSIGAALITATSFADDSAAPAPPAPPAPRRPVRITWSNPDEDSTPTNIPFHGPFSRETVTINCGNLPPHDFLEISFDFLAIRTLDGSVPMQNNKPVELGPDFFALALYKGPILFYTTFSNRPDDPGFQAASRWQNYPSQVPGEHLSPQTGAREKNSLGYLYPFTNASRPFPCDATYSIDFVIPHSGPTAMVQLTGMNLSDAVDESWGIKRFDVRAMPADRVMHPVPAAIEKAFNDSLNNDSDSLPKDFQTLIFGMNDTVNWIKANVTPHGIDAHQTEQLFEDLSLDDTQRDRREQAFNALAAMGPEIEPYLRDVRKITVGDLRQRVDWLLQNIGDTQITDDGVRRVMLATRVLEIIGTPEAMELRRKLTQSP